MLSPVDPGQGASVEVVERATAGVEDCRGEIHGHLSARSLAAASLAVGYLAFEWLTVVRQAKNIVKKEALELSQAAQKDAVAEHKGIMQRKKEYDLHQIQTEATLRHAKAKANFYKKMEKDVEANAARSKEAFKRYMKYKELYIEASANSGSADTVEINQYKKIAEQNLKAYSQLQVRMKDSKQNAAGASERYKELSKQYHAMVKEANQMSEQLSTMSAHYQHASARCNHPNDVWNLLTVGLGLKWKGHDTKRLQTRRLRWP